METRTMSDIIKRLTGNGALKPMRLMQIDGSKLDDEARLALAYWRFQMWEWDEIAGPKPDGFDKMKPFPRNFIERTFFSGKFRKAYLEEISACIREIIGDEKLKSYLNQFQQLSTEEQRYD